MDETQYIKNHLLNNLNTIYIRNKDNINFNKKYYRKYIEYIFSNNIKEEYLKSYNLLCNKFNVNTKLKYNNKNNKIILHCLTVSLKSYEISLKITFSEKYKKDKNIKLNLNNVVIGALLHDIGRSITHNISHGIEGANILKKYNYNNEIIYIVKVHIGAGIPKEEAINLNLPYEDYLQNTLEEKIVAHSDNLSFGNYIVTIDKVIDKFKNRKVSNNIINRIIKLNNEINYYLGK